LSEETVSPAAEQGVSVYADFDALADEYALPTEPFDIELDGGKKVQAKALADPASILNVEKFVQSMTTAVQGGAVPKDYKDLIPIDPAILRMCIYLEAFILQPKKSCFDWVKLSRSTGMLIPEIYNKMNEWMETAKVKAFDKAVDDAKND
jgi:hypothetical protein